MIHKESPPVTVENTVEYMVRMQVDRAYQAYRRAMQRGAERILCAKHREELLKIEESLLL